MAPPDNHPFESVIGLEVHAQLLTQSKIFCGCSTRFGDKPNSHTCPVCLGMPGVLPVINRKVVEFGVMTALALHCEEIPPRSIFARKNYFYPDLPKGYQISQYDSPLALDGFLEIFPRENRLRKIRITRIHLEEDAGKLIHGEGADSGSSFVDLNRAGVPLMEIVSEPDLRTPEEAGDYLRRLAAILVYLGVCDGKMEEGSLRCDANVSIRRRGETALGVKTELKNMNSFKNVEKALAKEIERQIELVSEGKKVIQETLLWDSDNEVTLPMRGKEEAHDYRYFPEPDLLPLDLEQTWIDEIKRRRLESPELELPREREERFVRESGIPEYDARVLVATKPISDCFNTTINLYQDKKKMGKKVSNWVMGDVSKIYSEEGGDKINTLPEKLKKIIDMVEEEKISGLIGKKVLEESYKTGWDPEKIVQEQGLDQVSDESVLTGIIDEVIKENPKEVERFRSGEEKLLQFLTGQVMKKSKGKANPKRVGELLKTKITKNE